VMKAELAPWPDWNQRTDGTGDGRVSENAANDCGPESAAECIKYITGVELQADYIKDAMYGEDYVGYSDVPHLCAFLNGRCAIPTESMAGDASTLLRPVVQKALSQGWPVIVLFFWDLSALSGGHFCPVVACDDQTMTRSNPWTGARERWSWLHFEMWQREGTAIVCRRQRSLVSGGLVAGAGGVRVQ